jgi:hypothetical protein
MKGFNSLQLNQQTMIEAVQEWVNAVFTDGHEPEVTSVHQSDDGKNFIVTIKGEEDGQEA